jgi:D-glycero-alpha-D-manno-heptose-7-phosphate kinase
MVITKTPYRISFFGGGTDYPQWYLKHGGAVLSTTIDKYCYISCRTLPPFFSNRYLIVWSHIEAVSTISEILHPAVREGLKYMGINGESGLTIHHQGDLPARAGMGSSSSFSVGLIKAISAHQGKMVGRHELAMKAIELEQNILKENVGSQDQVAAAYGGLNHISFFPSGEICVEPVTISGERIAALENNLMLFYTGTSRLASEVAGKVIANLEKKQDVIKQMQGMVDKGLAILNGPGSLDDFGCLLHENWLLKQSVNDSVSNNTINKIYTRALEHGALGGKLLGAGSSGFMVFYVPPEKQEDVREALAGYLYVPFKFDNEGSSIAYYTPRY